MKYINYGKLKEISDRLPYWNRSERTINRRGVAISRLGRDDIGFVLGGRILQEASIIAGGIFERGCRNSKTIQKIAHEISEAIEEYALAHEFIIDQEFLDGVSEGTRNGDVGGSEGIVFFCKHEKKVIKIVKHISHWLTDGGDGNLVVDWLKYFDYIAVNNSICPDVTIEVKGFCKDEDNDLCIVIEHDYIRGNEFNNYLDSRGIIQYTTDALSELIIIMSNRFNAKINDENGYEFINDYYIFGDTNPHNILKDSENGIHLFDVWIERRDRSKLSTTLVTDNKTKSRYNCIDVIL